MDDQAYLPRCDKAAGEAEPQERPRHGKLTAEILQPPGRPSGKGRAARAADKTRQNGEKILPPEVRQAVWSHEAASAAVGERGRGKKGLKPPGLPLRRCKIRADGRQPQGLSRPRCDLPTGHPETAREPVWWGCPWAGNGTREGNA